MTTLRSLPTVLTIAAILTALSACGGPADQGASALIDIIPAAAELSPGEVLKFDATADVDWATDGGAIDTTGVYTAPDTEGTYTVAASSLSTEQSTLVHVKRNIRVDVNPSTATLAPGESLALRAGVTGNNKAVTWAVVDPAGGAITTAGVFMAPETAGVYDVVATSVADPTRSDRATITVAEPPAPAAPAPIVTIAVSPQTASVVSGNTVQFTAAVTGLSDAGVTWSVAQWDGGTVSATGVYAAPPTAGTYAVVATSVADPTKTSSALVTVSSPMTKPVISSFTASPSTITQGASTTLGWTVSGDTSLSINGGVGPVTGLSSKTVTPSATTTYTLTATNAAGSVTATSTVTVNAPAPAPAPALAPAPAPAPAPALSGVGTGTTYGSSHVTGVTGGGPMPDWTTNVINAASYGARGDGVTDDTAALQNAANAARDQRKPLVIPATGSFYRTTSPILIYGSVGGIGGRPTIKTTNGAWDMGADVLRLMAGMTGWVYNLRLSGTFTTWTSGMPPGQWAHGIDVGPVNGLTIKGNIIENVKGDSIGTDYTRWGGGTTRSDNVIVDSNTLTNPLRCGIAFVGQHDRWVIVNNVITKPVPFVTAIDFEPESGGNVTNVEVTYNRFNSTGGYLVGYSDGFAVSMWAPISSPGGNIYLHHNYGSFGDGWFNGGSGWFNVVSHDNITGSNPP